MAMRRRSAARWNVHVDETVATLGVFAGHKDCVGVPHQPDVGQVWVIWLGKRQFPRGIIRWYRRICPVSHFSSFNVRPCKERKIPLLPLSARMRRFYGNASQTGRSSRRRSSSVKVDDHGVFVAASKLRRVIVGIAENWMKERF